MNDLDIKLNPLQIELINRLLFSTDKVVSARCGWGSGKTSSLIFAMLVASESMPGKTSLLITDTSNRFKTVLFPECQKWLFPVGWHFSPSDSILKSPSGHQVICRSYFRPSTHDSGSNSIEGINVSGWAFIDEAQVFSEEVLHKVIGRMRSSADPRIVIVGLPVFGAWWIDYSEKSGCKPLFYSSHVNKENLSEEWFKSIENLPENERLAMIENQPMPRSGLVYSEWGPLNVVNDFKYDPSMSSRIVIDFGFRKPSVLILTHDPIKSADVIVAEINPSEVSIHELAKMILEIACPRNLAHIYPGRILLDGASGDKAGGSRNDHTSITTFKALSKSPEEGGVGLQFRWSTDNLRTDIINGINRVKDLIGKRRILCTKEVWDSGSDPKGGSGNSFRKAILSYAWDSKETPKKSGLEDPLDALRYDVINFNWRDRGIDIPTLSKASYNKPILSDIGRKPTSFKMGRF